MIQEHVIHKDCFYETKYPHDTEIIDKHIEHLLLFDNGVIGSNRGGYKSHDITFGFKDLLEYSQECMNKIEPNFFYSNFWVNINKGTDYMIPHIHDFSGWSCVYYHKVCCDKTPLIFSHLVPQIHYQTHQFVPKDRSLVFFRQNIPHSVGACGHDNHQRISIAINFTNHRSIA